MMLLKFSICCLSLVNSREEFSQDNNHSAEDISRLLSERHGLEPPPARKERIRWPKSNDSAWEEFDLRVSLKLKEVQKTLRFQERMKSHCDVVYEEGVRWFGLMENTERTKTVSSLGDRRSARITALKSERRELRKSLRRAETELEQNGLKALLKLKNEGMGILTEARDWVLLADVNGQLKFPSEVATTRLRPIQPQLKELCGGS